MKRIGLLCFVACVSVLGCKKKTTTSETGTRGSGSAMVGSATDGAGPATAGSGSGSTPGSGAVKSATATLEAKSGSKVKGTVTFKVVEGGVEAVASIEGLTPGDHAWHVHEKGDCSSPDGKSAGGHFNPMNMQHGAPDAEQHHAGDFGNLAADKDGKATKTFVMKGITLDGGAQSIVGKGFIVHDKADDMTTQPTGNAGDRVACGVIQATP